MVFTIEHNANPFQQGLLVGAFQYGDHQYNRAAVPSMCTHLPHVRLNVSDHTQAVLTVPYLSEFEYWGGSDSERDHVLGRFALTQVLGTPALAGSSTPVFKVYFHLENISVFGRSPIGGTTFIVPQAGVGSSRIPGSSNAEAELRSNGKFSGILATAATLPGAVGRAFPSLRPFMGSATWFLNATAKAASAFGFSKPVQTSPLQNVMRHTNFFENVCDVPLTATVVGGFQSNSVAVSSALGGTDLDEMAFDTILTRPSQIFRGSIATTDSHGTVEYASKVCLMHKWFRAPGGVEPGNIAIPRGSSTAAAFLPSTLLFVGQHFRYWHGDLVYKVSFAKSKFHTGRVMFTFIPDYQQVSTASTYGDIGFAGGPVPGLFNTDLQPTQYSLIFDLKDGNEFEFEVPYIAPVSHVGINDSTGFVSMQVMDPLIANGESSTTINFIVEVAAKPGFYFSGLSVPGQPIWPDDSPPTPVIQFQSGVGAKAIEASQHSVGEKFNSIKQMLMCMTYRRYDLANGLTASGVIPFWPCAPAWGDGNPLAVNGQRNWALPRSGMFAQCYAYGIGSTMLYWYPNLGVNSGARVVLNERDNNSARIGTVPGVYGQAITSPTRAYGGLTVTNGIGMYKLPMLSGGPRFRMGDFNTSGIDRDWDVSASTYTTTSNTVKVIYNFLHRNNNGSTVTGFWGVCADDDARCAAWIGPCPLVLSNSATTVDNWWAGTPT
jgi:hypothetical protein